MAPFVEGFLLLHGAGQSAFARSRNLPTYWDSAKASRIIRSAYEWDAGAGVYTHLGRRGDETILASLEDTLDLPQPRSYKTLSRCHNHLSMMHTYQRLAWDELRRKVLLLVGNQVPAELTDSIFENVLDLEEVPLDPTVFVKVTGGGAPIIGDLVKCRDRYAWECIHEHSSA